MSVHFKKLMGKIEDRSARVGIIGLGYVGLPIVLRFCDEGFIVTGFDVDPEKIAALKKGRSYIKHIPSAKIAGFTKNRPASFTPTTDMSLLKKMDAIIICVPTPLTDKREPDLSYVVDTGRMIAKYIKPGTLVSLESTTYPGTTQELLLPLYEKIGLKAGESFFLAFSPEREDPGRVDFTIRTTPKVVGGITENCGKVAQTLYAKIVDKAIRVSSTQVAEMTKLLENIYRSVNIALVNELKMLCERMGIDIWEVINTAKTKPFGYEAFYPGPGLGGHCIPIDPFYLTWKAREFDFSTRFIELAGEINTNMPYYVVSRVVEALNERGKSVKGAKVFMLGVAYKKNVDDLRESPAIELIRILKEKGAIVSFNDPYVPIAVSHRKHFRMKSSLLTDKALSGSDCVLIATDHTCYDYKRIVARSRLVVDTRNATAGIKSTKIVKA